MTRPRQRNSTSLLNWLTYFPVESPARLETSLSALRRQKHPLRALRRGRREGGPLSPPTLARRAAWRVISIQQAPVLRLTLASRARAPLRSFTGLSIHQLSMGTRVLSIVGALYQWSREADVENNEEMQSPNGDARFLSSSGRAQIVICMGR